MSETNVNSVAGDLAPGEPVQPVAASSAAPSAAPSAPPPPTVPQQPAAPTPRPIDRWESLTTELLDLMVRIKRDWDHSLVREYLDKRGRAPDHVRDQLGDQARK